MVRRVQRGCRGDAEGTGPSGQAWGRAHCAHYGAEPKRQQSNRLGVGALCISDTGDPGECPGPPRTLSVCVQDSDPSQPFCYRTEPPSHSPDSAWSRLRAPHWYQGSQAAREQLALPPREEDLPRAPQNVPSADRHSPRQLPGKQTQAGPGRGL